MNKTNKIVTITMGVIILILAGYLATDMISERLNEKYQEVYQLGVDQTIQTIYGVVINNGYVELNIENETLILVPYIEEVEE